MRVSFYSILIQFQFKTGYCQENITNTFNTLQTTISHDNVDNASAEYMSRKWRKHTTVLLSRSYFIPSKVLTNNEGQNT